MLDDSLTRLLDSRPDVSVTVRRYVADVQTTSSSVVWPLFASSSPVRSPQSISVSSTLLTEALHVVIQYWAPDLNPAITITTGLVLLILANGFSARVYGEIGECVQEAGRLIVRVLDLHTQGHPDAWPVLVHLHHHAGRKSYQRPLRFQVGTSHLSRQSP